MAQRQCHMPEQVVTERTKPLTTNDSRNMPELLAPAGGPEALRAAVNNGADAVYLGIDRLNARRGAENFTLDALPEATRFAHLKGARVYLTANIVVLPDELDDALSVADQAWAAGVDALIVQDLGFLHMLRSELPDVRVHASTQLNTHNSLTVAELARAGVSRVTLARETALGEIAALSASSSIEVESFVHGALCVSYSGQCLLSSLIGGRSANRGVCAQPCRMVYELLDERGKTIETPGAHLLSPRDLCTIDSLDELVKTNVSALKIEGRMKDPEYVALVTGVYRQALDRAFADPDGYTVTDSERSILAEAFSRGFSSAYLDDIRDNRMMSYQRPNNRGVPVGRVSKVEERDIRIALDSALDAEDTIEVWTSRGRFAQRVGEISMGGQRVPVAPSGTTVTIRAERSASVGDRVFRVANAALARAARRTFSDERGQHAFEVDVAVRLVEGEPLRVEVRLEDAVGIAEGPVVEVARTKAVTAEEITEHVGRMGGTLFEARSWDIELQPGVGIGFSVLHRVRKEALEALEAQILEPWAGRRALGPKVPVPPRGARSRGPAGPELIVTTSDIVTARSCLAAGARRVVMPHWALQQLDREEIPDDVEVELPRIAHDREVPDLVELMRSGERIVVGNLGLVRAAAERGAIVDAHWSLNALNGWTVAALDELGAAFVWLSPELSGRQIAGVVSGSKTPVGVAVYGRQEVMVTEHCVLMAAGPCGQVCGTCPRRASWYALRDRKGYSFPVSSDPMGRSHVYNSVPLDLTRAAPEIVAAGVSAIRLDFTVERAQQAQKITRIVKEAFAAAIGERDFSEVAAQSATTGHFYRGVH